jgi:hypothetical protein
MVRVTGFGPATFRSQTERSTRLSYTLMVSVTGFEPATSWLQTKWATVASHAVIASFTLAHYFFFYDNQFVLVPKYEHISQDYSCLYNMLLSFVLES